MLGRRRRRQANSNLALGQSRVFDTQCEPSKKIHFSYVVSKEIIVKYIFFNYYHTNKKLLYIMYYEYFFYTYVIPSSPLKLL